MDKHTRPYICEEPGCENIRGFTYSGGLLRHQREVHRQHGGPRASCMCPHKDCKRSTGVGFSRKENLHEHLRRVHRDVGPEGGRDLATVTTDQVLEASGSQTQSGSRKRKRRVHEDANLDEEEGESQQDLKQQVKKLRRELQEKDERLRKLEQRFEELVRSGDIYPTR